MIKNTFLNLFCFTVLIAAATSCKKTEDLPALPNSKILEYNVPVSDGDIHGVIDEADKTITVYLPFYYQLDVIDPQIKLAAGAKLKEEIVPIDVLNTTTSYTVTGADNSVSTYKLVIQLQQITPLVVGEVSEEGNPTTWAIGQADIYLTGNFNTSDATKIKAYLVDAAGKEWPMGPSKAFSEHFVVPSDMGDGTKTYVFAYLQTAQNLEPGSYKLRVKIQALTAEAKNPINVDYGTPALDYGPTTVKQGDTFKMKTSTQIFHGLKEVSILVGGVKTLLPVENYTRSEATIRIPETVPAGNYVPTMDFGDLGKVAANWQVTVTAK